MNADPGALADFEVLVERPGMLTSVQDGGRFGWQHVGVVPSGAMDWESLQLANALVGNAPDAAGLEITLRGPTLWFGCDALVALGGALFAARVSSADGHDAPCPLNRPVLLRAGSRLTIEQATHGFRAYLALAGGLHLAPVLGSRCTYMPAAIGGIDGRALKKGDRLQLAPHVNDLAHARFDRTSVAQRMSGHLPYGSVRWAMLPRSLPHQEPIVVRCIDGHHRELFDTAALTAFESTPYRISSQSNRMGYRMLGEKLQRSQDRDVLSEPTALGTVQVPPDGLPIVLMADHQTTGGYAKIAEVASADIGRLAQLRPGQQVQFVRCAVGDALALAQAAHGQLQSTIAAIGLKLNPGAHPY